MRVSRKIWFFVIMIMSLIFAMAFMDDATRFMKGNRIDFNKSEKADFSDPHAVINGKIDFVYGPFATYEETTKKYGLTVHKKETNYYVVSNLEDTEFFTVLSTSDKDLISKLDSAADKWYDYFTVEEAVEPVVSIEFDGKLNYPSSMEDYETYYNEAVDDLANVGVEKSMFADMQINEGKVTVWSVVAFVACCVLTLVSFVLMIISFIVSRRR
ncbi:MAG: hypothetical protein K2I80_04100 [Ruminococcus sp.]|nr:hypothetical protein [Ruminococcus sp.]MDE6848753.1 hypothetical protein [Ruminococcus sp.]